MDLQSLPGQNTVAAVDCGTNSTRLLIADEHGRELIRLMRITRLGQGVENRNELSPSAIQRTVNALREFRTSMDAMKTTRVRMVATSAVRDATNGEEFVRHATTAIGSAPEILDGLEEGKLAYSGANADLPKFDGDTLVVDIGGGSTELVLGRRESVTSVSLQLGCVRLTERFLTHDPPTSADISATRNHIAKELIRGEQTVSELKSMGQRRRLVGLAGTVSTLASLHLGLDHYESNLLHHARLPERVVGELCLELSRISAQERGKLKGMVKGREDVILGGGLVLEMIASRYQFEEVIVSEHDILDGIILSIL